MYSKEISNSFEHGYRILMAIAILVNILFSPKKNRTEQNTTQNNRTGQTEQKRTEKKSIEYMYPWWQTDKHTHIHTKTHKNQHNLIFLDICIQKLKMQFKNLFIDKREAKIVGISSSLGFGWQCSTQQYTVVFNPFGTRPCWW